MHTVTSRRAIGPIALSLSLAAATGGCVAFPFLGADQAVDGPAQEATTWEVVDLTGGSIPAGLMLATVHPVTFVISPDGSDDETGSMGGSTRCNGFGSRYSVPNKAELRVRDAYMTAIPCDAATAAIEAALIAMLPDLRSWTRKADTLTFRTSDGRRVRLAPPGQRLALQSVDAAALPVVVSSDAGGTTSIVGDTLVLRGDGLALFRTHTSTTGAGGTTTLTETLTARYSTVGDSIRFTPATVCLAATCPPYTANGGFGVTEVRVKRFTALSPVSYRYLAFAPLMSLR